MQFLEGSTCKRGTPSGPCPPRALPQDKPQRKVQLPVQETIQGGAGRRGPRPPLLLHEEGVWDSGPCPPQIHARIQKFIFKLNIPSKTITNSFLVMATGRYGLIRKCNSARPMLRNRLAHCADFVARLRAPCTSCLSVHGALNLCGSWLGRQSLP